MIVLTHYLTVDGFDPFQAWLNRLKRRDPQALLRVLTRLNRLAFGHADDSKALGRGLHELRLHHGPGYRIYYGWANERLVILLAGGGKRRQAEDISRARERWADYRERRP